ncbi:MAG TPA: O-antigen ligase family protein [Dyella sp.]|uniref:O-antigen ligase family protein n=1 Tax=Dyella sp. TaxID=1869338 RepID=UPI002D7A1DB5|nr:O-antigen ligase family protein [Dyella sp.]HET6552953.1 O-antigen ligase family protein [Dyella sp.]
MVRSILGIGIAWMMLGMVVMPAGVSFNPGKAYQASLILLLYLPALVLAFSQRALVWRQLWPLPAFRVFLVLVAWAALSLTWGGPAKPGNELGRLISVMAFVLGWDAYARDDAARIRQLLLGVGLAIAACALFYSAKFVVDPVDDGRIVGEGTIATANYAAALMGVVALWLSQLSIADRRWSRLRWVAILPPLVFVALTQTRSVWLALCVSAVLMPLWLRPRRFRWVVPAILVAALALAVWPTGLLLERGTSLRPELFLHSMHLIMQHPLQGLGQGAPFLLLVNGANYTHTHNLLTQVTVELGLPGLLLTVAMWLLVAWQGWRHRDTMQGRLVLAIWVYASVVLQFDMPQMLDSPRPAWLLVWLPFALTLGMAWRDRQTIAAQ